MRLTSHWYLTTPGRIFKEESPDMILDAFLENNRPPSELSLDCETTFKADYWVSCWFAHLCLHGNTHPRLHGNTHILLTMV